MKYDVGIVFPFAVTRIVRTLPHLEIALIQEPSC